MPDLVLVALSLTISFFIGSLPFSFWIAKVFRGIDIRTLGSGNVGATNVFRTQGKVLGSLALTLDAVKGVIAVAVVPAFFPEQQVMNPFLFHTLNGIAAICGHIWTPFLGGKGGKGVATSAGVFLALMPGPFFIALAVFIGVFLKARIISISSLTAVLTFLIAVFFLYRNNPDGNYALISSLIVAIFIFYAHRANIGRLMRGEEKKL